LLDSQFYSTHIQISSLGILFQIQIRIQLSWKLLKHNSAIDISCLQQPDRYSPQPSGNKGTAAGYSLPCSPLQASTSMSAPNTNGVAATVSQSSAIGGVVSSMISGSPTSFYTLINSLQLLAYLPLSTIPIPQSLRNLLSSLHMQFFFPNPFLYWLRTDEGRIVPDFAASYGYESCLFLINCGVMICVGVLVLLYWE